MLRSQANPGLRNDYADHRTAIPAGKEHMASNFVNPETMHSPDGYTHVVEVTSGRLAYISGQVALDRDGKLVSGGIRSQTRQAFENMRAALAAVGGTLGDVVKLTTYLLDVTEMDAVREVRSEYFDPGRLPAATAVEVPRLEPDGVLIEIEAIAVLSLAPGQIPNHGSGGH
jgi:enamine deaminase RidA (YjgF/YER057c/UK114 family)